MVFMSKNYIFGLPDDDMDSMNQTLDLSMRINSEWSNFILHWHIGISIISKQTKKEIADDENGPGWIGYSQHA